MNVSIFENNDFHLVELVCAKKVLDIVRFLDLDFKTEKDFTFFAR